MTRKTRRTTKSGLVDDDSGGQKIFFAVGKTDSQIPLVFFGDDPPAMTARTDPVTVVHELLHLFGATDKYGQALRSFVPGSVTSRDVMRLNEERLSRLRVDALTAFEVGWNSNSPDPKKTTAPRHRSSGRSSRFRQTDMGG